MSSLKTADTVGFERPTTRAACDRESGPRSWSASTTERRLMVRAMAGVALAKLRFSAIGLPSGVFGAESARRRHSMPRPRRRPGGVLS
jgi:hypothetical protein